MKVFITGASSGIGEALAREYRRRHPQAALGLVARRADALHALAHALDGDRTLALPADVADRGAMQRAADTYVQRFGVPDVVIANAGISAGTVTGAPGDAEVFERIVRTNVIALFDTFGGHRTILGRAREMVAERDIDHVVLYTWSADVDLLSIARASGVSGVLSKASGAAELVDGLERIAAGERVGLDAPLKLAGHHMGSTMTPQFDLQANLTAREQEVLAMLGLGLSNRDIANELFLGVETVRTYVRQVYQKLGVKNRTQAAVRARVLGLEPATERRPAAS